MSIHYKIDLLNDEAMATFTIQVGDVLLLDVPSEGGGFTSGYHEVLDIEQADLGVYEGTHYTQVTLTLKEAPAPS
jgi:hypothetical protein